MSGNFIDSSVFIYQLDETAPVKQRIADEIVFTSLGDRSGVISYQVVQETLNVVTGKFATVVAEQDRDSLLNDVLVPLWKVMPSETLFRRALVLKGRYGYSFYDSLIVAAALAAGCSRLYSEDLHHEQRIEDLTIINPFGA